MKLLTLFLTLIISPFVLAHPGHDHSALTSDAIHALFALSIISVVGLAVYLVAKHRKQQEKK